MRRSQEEVHVKRMRACLVMLACPMLLPAAASAQTTSAIAGVVKDTSGAVLPGVTVEAGSPALIERTRSAVTDVQGQYKITELRPGLYSVTFTLSGFSVAKRDGIELTANFTAAISVELTVGALSETVTVSGQSALVDVQNVNQQKTFSRALLDTVPTNKGMLGYAALVPAVVSPPNAQDVGGSKGELSGPHGDPRRQTERPEASAGRHALQRDGAGWNRPRILHQSRELGGDCRGAGQRRIRRSAHGRRDGGRGAEGRREPQLRLLPGQLRRQQAPG